MAWRNRGAFWALVLLGLSLSGCNTMEGVGEDVEAAGGALEREAEETKGY